ncbi:unnamed protein product [Cylicocyclus nassatus]|uniref:GPI inositol-deacylase n=1 Tax=Cylicocyclus nassatus TaxID=53992 RepID=A0AA36GJ81_CYLNA|nr:unnamed protein product [Cylicocyclus nassatus]
MSQYISVAVKSALITPNCTHFKPLRKMFLYRGNELGVCLPIGLVTILFLVHVGLHKENACQMTYMWRYISLLPIKVDGNDVRSYSLFRYLEGIVNERTLAISQNHIPVLFVPGSGGSGKQVRSLASVMMNKTEMRSAPFRMHFYAVDFNEELSFLSGSILNRQRNFVISAISTIQRKYYRKLVLVGHSFGGAVLYALPAHPRYDISNMGLVMTLAAPITAPPLMMDEKMVSFYNSMHETWRKRNEELNHVGVVSYSGGLKDFQVPDHLAPIPENDRAVHRPSWSIRGVDTPADHLCILWCNQLVRHTTKLLYKYGEEEVLRAQPPPPSVVVRDFFHKANGSRIDVGASSDIIKIGVFDYPWVSRVYRGSVEKPSKAYELEFHSLHMVYKVYLASTCDMDMFFVYSDLLARSAETKSSGKVMVANLVQGANQTKGHIILKGKSGCEFELTVKPDIFFAWYVLLISNTNVLVHFTFSALIALMLLEKLLDLKRYNLWSLSGLYINGGILLSLFICFTYNTCIREAVFAASIFYLVSCAYLITAIIALIKDKIYSTFPLCLNLVSAVLKLVVVVLLPLNIYLSNAAMALIIALHKSSGPYTILLGIATGAIVAALGLADRVEMDDDSDYDDEQLESPHSSQAGSMIGVMDNGMEDPKRHARAQHNALERRRRDNIKDMYTSLKDVVPDMQNERASRAVILRRAIEVIEEKQQQRADLRADCDRLRNEMAELEREVARLRENLAKPSESSRSSISGNCSPQPTSLQLLPSVKVEPELRSEMCVRGESMG